MPHRGERRRDETKLQQRELVLVCVSVDSLLCKSLDVALDTDLKDPYPLDRAEVMAYLRDVVRQSDE